MSIRHLSKSRIKIDECIPFSLRWKKKKRGQNEKWKVKEKQSTTYDTEKGGQNVCTSNP